MYIFGLVQIFTMKNAKQAVYSKLMLCESFLRKS